MERTKQEIRERRMCLAVMLLFRFYLRHLSRRLSK